MSSLVYRLVHAPVIYTDSYKGRAKAGFDSQAKRYIFTQFGSYLFHLSTAMTRDSRLRVFLASFFGAAP